MEQHNITIQFPKGPNIIVKKELLKRKQEIEQYLQSKEIALGYIYNESVTIKATAKTIKEGERYIKLIIKKVEHSIRTETIPQELAKILKNNKKFQDAPKLYNVKIRHENIEESKQLQL